jgi:hypothetical protein
MRVGKQQGEIERLFFKLGHQLASEQAQAGSGIEDDDLSPDANFDAGGIASVMDGGGSRGGNGATNAPKFETRARSQAVAWSFSAYSAQSYSGRLVH